MGPWNRSAVTLAAVLVLAACGGGGGGGDGSVGGVGTGARGDGGSGGTIADPVPPTPTTGQPPSMRQLQGTVLFESIPALPGGGLDYENITRKPARGVMFELRDTSGKAVASGTTDEQGRYSVQALSGTAVTLSVYAALTSADGKLSTGVYDNTAGGALLGAKTSTFTVGGKEVNRMDLLLRSGWRLGVPDRKPEPDGDRVAAPFAIVDTIYQSRARLFAAAPDLVLPKLTVFWSTSNAYSTTSDPANGQVGPTSFWEKDGERFILLQGKPNVDTDEYDSTVIAHEWGHYFQHALSRSDSPGGPHGSADLLDRSLAFGEGWGTAWSGIALGTDTYTDSYGPRQAEGLVLNLATPPTVRPGWFNEASLAHVLWKLNQAAGLRPIVQALRGSFRTIVASAGIHAFQASLREVDPVASKTMEKLLQSQSISGTSDAWGTTETNDGGLAIALPMVHALVAGQPTSGVCVSSALDPAGVGNKLGSRAYLRFSIATAGTYRFDLQGTAGSDPDWAIRDIRGVLKASNDATPLTDTTTLELKAGDYLMTVHEHQHLNASTCFTVKFQ